MAYPVFIHRSEVESVLTEARFLNKAQLNLEVKLDFLAYLDFHIKN